MKGRKHASELPLTGVASVAERSSVDGSQSEARHRARQFLSERVTT